MTFDDHCRHVEALHDWGYAFNYTGFAVLAIGALSALVVPEAERWHHLLNWWSAFVLCQVFTEAMIQIARWHMRRMKAENDETLRRLNSP